MPTSTLWDCLPAELRQRILQLYLHDVIQPEQLWKEKDLQRKEDLIRNIAAFGAYHARDDVKEALERWQRNDRRTAKKAGGSSWLPEQQAKWRKGFAEQAIDVMEIVKKV